MEKREKNIVVSIIVLVLIVAVAIGAYFAATNTDQGEGEVTVTVMQDGEMITEEDLTFEEDQTLLALMEEHFDAQHNDGFIYSIEGIEQDMDANQFWIYEVNDEEVMVGAGEYILEDGDMVVWELAQF